MEDVEALKERVAELEAQLKVNVPVNQKLKSRDYSTTKYVPKNPLGMKDFGPEETCIREEVMNKITKIFKVHGAVSIETPAVELKATLTGKYGEDAESEDSKLIYDLKDQGGEILSLRYDLTVPFARFCAQNKVESLKRYQIGKVYRRDRPVLSKGRFREFYQCDFDIAGSGGDCARVQDAECVKLMCDVLSTTLSGIEFVIRINHRKLLDGMFEVSGVDVKQVRTVSSSIDKLDKLPWAAVREELRSKGITDSVCNNIEQFLDIKGLNDLRKYETLLSNSKAKEGIEELEELFGFLSDLGCSSLVEFDISLARGLDYYTGVIYEAVGKGKDSDEERIGSLAAGGRYDNLISTFKKKGKEVPCVGVSFGLERIFALNHMENSKKGEKWKVLPTDVLVCVVGVGKSEQEKVQMVKERLKVLQELWENDISSETIYKSNPKALTQFQFCEENLVPFAVILAPEELSRNEVKIRNIATRDESTIPRSDLVRTLLSSLNR